MWASSNDFLKYKVILIYRENLNAFKIVSSSSNFYFEKRLIIGLGSSNPNLKLPIQRLLEPNFITWTWTSA